MLQTLQLLLTQSPIRHDRAAGIDALRGALALWVVLAHLIPWTVLVQGPLAAPSSLQDLSQFLSTLFQPNAELHPAVLGFIVLSGYCVHRAGYRASVGDVTRYGMTRAFRILPCFFAATAFGMLTWRIAIGHDPSLGRALSGTQSIEADCLIAKLSTLAAIVPSYHPCSYAGNAPLATVMVEITLYVSYAAIFMLIWRGCSCILPVVCGASWIVGLGAATVAKSNPSLYSWWQNSSLWGFLPYWWLGAIFLHPRVESAVRRRWPMIAAAWIALTTWLWLGAANALISEIRKGIFCFLVGWLILHLDRSTVSRLTPLSILGRASYSLYAFAAPVTYTLTVIGVPWWASLMSSILVGYAAYLAIERPMIALGRMIRAAITSWTRSGAHLGKTARN
jgi:peptidoglycan/LPS O-acetylase OafA/YrhL